MKLNIAAFALAFGVWWGGGIFLLTWWLLIMGADPGEVTILSEVYAGYAVSAAGSFIGLIWGVICGGICGAILAWLYNLFSKMLVPSVTA
jgi:hypothetical protein